MNLSPAWCATLEQVGHEAWHWLTIGAANASDTEIMLYAQSHRLVVLTCDLDFGIMVVERREHAPSVIQLRATDVRPEQIGTLLKFAVAQVHEELEQGAILTLYRDRIRLRSLRLT